MSEEQSYLARLDEIEHTPATTPQEIADQNATAIEILTEVYNNR